MRDPAEVIDGALDTTAVRRAHADAATVAEFLSRTGYQLPVAIADLIDNAIDAGASRVSVGLILRDGRPATLAVADNGRGMTPIGLELAVSLEKDSRKQDGRSLGRYGAGLKAASFSLGRVLTLATKAKGGTPIGAVLDQQEYRNNYEYRVLAEETAALLFDSTWGGEVLGESGTILLLSDLAAMVPRSDSSQDLFLDGFGAELDVRLGLIFHRFLQSERLTIVKSKRAMGDFRTEFGQYAIPPVDPFGYPKSGHRAYPKKLQVDTGQSIVPIELHLWPKQGRTKATRHHLYEILGRSGEWQGLYFYRWDRLLQAGGWNGLRSQEPHMSYARVVVDLPFGSDAEFRPTVMKDRIENARPLLGVLMAQESWTEFMSAAGHTYRGGAVQGNGRVAGHTIPGRVQLGRPEFVRLQRRPTVRVIDGHTLQIDRRLVTALGQRRAAAVGELVWQALRPVAGRKRLTPRLRDDLARLEKAVASLAVRLK